MRRHARVDEPLWRDVRPVRERGSLRIWHLRCWPRVHGQRGVWVSRAALLRVWGGRVDIVCRERHSARHGARHVARRGAHRGTRRSLAAPLRGGRGARRRLRRHGRLEQRLRLNVRLQSMGFAKGHSGPCDRPQRHNLCGHRWRPHPRAPKRRPPIPVVRRMRAYRARVAAPADSQSTVLALALPRRCADYASSGRCAGGFLPGEEWTGGADFGEPELHCCVCGKPTPCADTPEWKNEYRATCVEYERDGHCAGGAFAAGHEYTGGSEFGSPWRHCCVCGKGKAAAPPPPPPRQPPPSPPRPPPPSPPPDMCTDTPGWQNPFGMDCAGMAVAGHCLCTSGFRPGDCGFKVGHEWAGGAKFQHPELNCCLCGKGAPHRDPTKEGVYVRSGGSNSGVTVSTVGGRSHSWCLWYRGA